MPRKSEGRQKIEIARITNESSLSVAFTKRRSGIFKKASELCTLCGVHMAILVLSKNKKKMYSFGDPSVEAIVNRFMEQSADPPRSRTSKLMEDLRITNIRELYTQLTSMLGQLESEKKAGVELHKVKKERQQSCWWDKPVEGLALAELEQLKMAVLELKESAQRQVDNGVV